MRVTVKQETRDGYEVQITPILPHPSDPAGQKVCLLIRVSDLSLPEDERVIGEGLIETRRYMTPGASLDLIIEREH